MRNFTGKVAFITGGASGIGLGIARTFMEAGIKVVIGDCNQEHLEEAMKYLTETEGIVHAIRFDVTERRSVQTAADEAERVFGRIDILVNNAGVQNRSTLSTISYDEWDALMGVNLGGVFNGIRTLLPRIKQHGEGGHVLAISSTMGLFTAGGGYAAYCASKFAVVAMMEALRAELAGVNIGVSVVCPGAVRSNLERGLKESPVASDPIRIAQRILRGMRRNDLYILTNPEFDVVIQARNDAILASSPRDFSPSKERIAIAQSVLGASVYLSERNRERRS